MADYEGRVAAADFGSRVAEVRSMLDRFGIDYLPIIDREDDGILDRLNLLLDHALVVTSVPTGELVPQRVIADLTAVFDQIDTALTGLEELDASTITVAKVAALSSAVEQLSAMLFQWPPRTDGEDWRDAVTNAASTYRRSLGQQLTSLQSQVDGATELLAQLRSHAEVLVQSHQDGLDVRTQAFAAELESLSSNVTGIEQRVTSADEQIARSVQRADQVLGEFQKQFAAAQEQRSNDFRTAQDSLTTKFQADVSSLRQDAEAAVAAIQQQVDQAAELVSVFAAAGTANAYSKEARDQERLANNWRRTAIVLALFTAAAAVSLFFGHSGDNPDWALVSGKVALGLTFAGVAGYAASQSAHHRSREETARHLELNIAAFGPFVRELDESKQSEARERVLDAIFLRPIGTGGSTDKASVTEDQISILGQFIDQIRKLK